MTIKKGWNDQKEFKNIMFFLQGHDVPTAHATKIYKQYGAKSIETVTENGGYGDGTKAGLHAAGGSMSTLAIAESFLPF